MADEQVNVDAEQDDTDADAPIKEIATLEDILDYDFMGESTKVFDGLNEMIRMIDSVLTPSKTKNDMLRILNGGLNNILLVHEIIMRNGRENNILPELIEDDEDVADEDVADDATAGPGAGPIGDPGVPTDAADNVVDAADNVVDAADNVVDAANVGGTDPSANE